MGSTDRDSSGDSASSAASASSADDVDDVPCFFQLRGRIVLCACCWILAVTTLLSFFFPGHLQIDGTDRGKSTQHSMNFWLSCIDLSCVTKTKSEKVLTLAFTLSSALGCACAIGAAVASTLFICQFKRACLVWIIVLELFSLVILVGIIPLVTKDYLDRKRAYQTTTVNSKLGASFFLVVISIVVLLAIVGYVIWLCRFMGKLKTARARMVIEMRRRCIAAAGHRGDRQGAYAEAWGMERKPTH